MTKSFFERLTGSIRIGDKEQTSTPGDQDDDASVYSARPTAAKVGRPKTKRGSTVLESREETAVSQALPRFEEANAPAASFKEPRALATQADNEEEGELLLDIYDDGTSFVAQTTAAGVRPEDIDISVSGDTLTVRGVRRKQQEIHDDRYYAKELYWGRFSRFVVLPEEVDGEKADASFKNGLLTIRIPKKSNATLRKIKVRSE